MGLTQPGQGQENVGQSIEALGLTYVDSNNNPVAGLNISGLTVNISDSTVVSKSYDATNSAWKFTGLKAGTVSGAFVDPATNFQTNFGITVSPAEGSPAGILFTSWSTPA